MIVYKVTTTDQCSIWATSDNLCVQYKVGSWVRPKRWAQRRGLYLLAFRDLESAKTWLKGRFSGCPIWKAAAQEVHTDLRMPGILNLKDLCNIAYHKGVGFDLMGSVGSNELFDYFPAGTVLCSAIKLLEQEPRRLS